MAARKPAQQNPVELPTLSVFETLKAARALIEDETSWVQGRAGDCINTFCASSALMTTNPRGYAAAWRALQTAMGGGWVSSFNDFHTHAEVLAAYDLALDIAREL